MPILRAVAHQEPITTPVAHTMSRTSCPIAVPKGVAGEVGGGGGGLGVPVIPFVSLFCHIKEDTVERLT